ncbi:global nitrogen regulator [Clostridiales bacterium]|nr:global nitrogen regulator [Clostridiales bacterium]
MKTILILSHGDLFGEVTLFHNDIDLVITQAFVNTSIIKIPSQVFLTALKKNPEYYYYISVMISNKFKILMAQLHDSSFFDVSLRLKNLLIRLADQMGTPTESGTKINYRFTHEEMAYMINSTRSTVTKKLSELEEKKVISYENKFIIVHNTQIKK